MNPKINPFSPNAPVSPGMFIGRFEELNSMRRALRQTKAGIPENFMITGERGIGKTSLINFIMYEAKGDMPVDEPFNFLVATIDISQNTTQPGLMNRVLSALDAELSSTDKAKAFIKEAWSFIKRLESSAIKLRDENPEDQELQLDKFATSLSKTVERITSDEAESIFCSRYDGILLLIDEADNASSQLDMGSFFKSLFENLQRKKCNNFMIGLSGLDRLPNVLRESHESSLRLFNKVQLNRLDNTDVNKVIDACLTKANESNARKTTVSDKGRETLASLAEGYPHFIQQFGYCAFEADTDNEISDDDIFVGAAGNNGAISLIGDRYYRDDYYNKINKDSYRAVLEIMADDFGNWVTKDQIKKKFTGKNSTLDNAIQALRKRNIIQSKEGARGVYRLRDKAFAHWIKLFANQ